LVALLNLFLVVFVFEPSLLPRPPLARNLKLLLVVGVLVVLVAALLFVVVVFLLLLPEGDEEKDAGGDVCTKLEFLFKEEKEVLATAALAEPPPPKQPSTTIKLLAVRMTLFFLRSVRCARAACATDYPKWFSALLFSGPTRALYTPLKKRKHLKKR
jgi:hypothetical protein